MPPIFGFVQRAGNIDEAEMYRVFNMGLGMVIVVAALGWRCAAGRAAGGGRDCRGPSGGRRTSRVGVKWAL